MHIFSSHYQDQSRRREGNRDYERDDAPDYKRGYRGSLESAPAGFGKTTLLAQWPEREHGEAACLHICGKLSVQGRSPTIIRAWALNLL